MVREYIRAHNVFLTIAFMGLKIDLGGEGAGYYKGLAKPSCVR